MIVRSKIRESAAASSFFARPLTPAVRPCLCDDDDASARHRSCTAVFPRCVTTQTPWSDQSSLRSLAEPPREVGARYTVFTGDERHETGGGWAGGRREAEQLGGQENLL